MEISVPERMLNEKIMKGFEELGYKVKCKKDDSVTFEGVFSLRVTADLAGMGVREFITLCKKLTVKGGRKIRRGGTLFIEPIRMKRLTVRLSNDEYEALKKVARERGYTKRNLSSFFRDSLITSLLTRMEKMGVL